MGSTVASPRISLVSGVGGCSFARCISFIASSRPIPATDAFLECVMLLVDAFISLNVSDKECKSSNERDFLRSRDS